MQIKVEIEVKPEELRRFLGLPDVSGLQDEVVQFFREKMGQASEGLTPAAEFVKDKVGQAAEGLSPAAEFVRENLGNLKDSGSATLQRLISSVKVRLTEPDPPPAAPAPAQAARKRSTAASKPRKRAAGGGKKTSAARRSKAP